MIEPLDTRSLLSSTLVNGVLTVTGTDRSETITVDLQGDYIVAFDGTSTQRFKRIDRIEVFANGGNDRVAVSVAVSTFLRGGAGNDRIDGGPGGDRIIGDSGNDEMYGNAGSDRLDGGGGSDLLSGGADRDTVDYSRRTANLNLTILIGKYDDGERGENDFIRDDIEGIDSGSGDDGIVGWYGEDIINGGDGNDTIRGDRGKDTLNGEGGHDDIRGNDGSDYLTGGDGDDFIHGGNGDNYLNGGPGDDDLDARNDDADDDVDGGGGSDTAWIDVDVNSFDDDFFFFDEDEHTRIDKLRIEYI